MISSFHLKERNVDQLKAKYSLCLLCWQDDSDLVFDDDFFGYGPSPVANSRVKREPPPSLDAGRKTSARRTGTGNSKLAAHGLWQAEKKQMHIRDQQQAVKKAVSKSKNQHHHNQLSSSSSSSAAALKKQHHHRQPVKIADDEDMLSDGSGSGDGPDFPLPLPPTPPTRSPILPDGGEVDGDSNGPIHGGQKSKHTASVSSYTTFGNFLMLICFIFPF